MSGNYDVAFRFVNNTEWTATLEAWGPDPGGRGNGVMLMLRPGDRVAFMQNANVPYYYCVRHHGIEGGFSYVNYSSGCLIAKRDRNQCEDPRGHASEHFGNYAIRAPGQLRHHYALVAQTGRHGEKISPFDSLHKRMVG